MVLEPLAFAAANVKRLVAGEVDAVASTARRLDPVRSGDRRRRELASGIRVRAPRVALLGPAGRARSARARVTRTPGRLRESLRDAAAAVRVRRRPWPSSAARSRSRTRSARTRAGGSGSRRPSWSRRSPRSSGSSPRARSGGRPTAGWIRSQLGGRARAVRRRPGRSRTRRHPGRARLSRDRRRVADGDLSLREPAARPLHDDRLPRGPGRTRRGGRGVRKAAAFQRSRELKRSRSDSPNKHAKLTSGRARTRRSGGRRRRARPRAARRAAAAARRRPRWPVPARGYERPGSRC